MDYGYSNQNQYSTTSYGAQGGAGGGGFMNGGGSSQENSGSVSKGYGKDTLRPVTIKQIIDAQQPHPDAEFRVDGAEITHITFVGQIRNISTQATNQTYKLDDGTGTMEVKIWLDPESSASVLELASTTDASIKARLTENTYARVWGRLKSFNSKKHVGAIVIRPVMDYNEIQYHLLEATTVHLHMTRGPPGGGKQALQQGLGQHQQQQQQHNGYDAGAGAAAGAGGAKVLPARLSGAARRVYGCLNQEPQSNEGLHVHEIAGRLHMDIAEVSKAGDDLLSEGLIYTTVDDNTWAVLDDI